MRHLAHRVAAALAAALLLAPAAPAAAADGDVVTWQAYPGGADEGRPYFEASVAPGGSFEGVVVLENLSAVEIRLALYGADASVSADGTFALREEGDGPGTVAAWFRPARGVVTVPPRSEARVPFVLAVPADAPPGDYGGAVLSSLDTSAAGGQRLVARVGVRTYLRVTGDLAPEVSVADPDVRRAAPWWNPFSGDVAVGTTVTNTGNTRVRVDADAATASVLGSSSGDVSPAGVELWPGDSVVLDGRVAGASSLVALDASLAVHPALVDGDDLVPLPDVLVASRLLVVPWPAIAAILVLAALVAALVVGRRRTTPVPTTRPRESTP